MTAIAKPPSDVSLYLEFMSLAVSHIVWITLSKGTFAFFGSVSNANSAAYIPNFALLFYSEIIVNSFLVILCIYLIYLFFTKNKRFPKYYIFITLFVILTIPVDAYLASIVLPNEKMLDMDTIKSFFQSLFSGAIWIPYMLKSERVRNTFVED